MLNVFASLCAWSAAAQIVPNSSTPNWIPILDPTPDPFSDQQTGSKESDIVGTQTAPSLYTAFWNGGTSSLTDGQIAFRLRLAEEKNPPGYSGAAFIGIDANADGKLDVFAGVHNSGVTAAVGLWRPGNGLNISPSTTTLESPGAISYQETSLNYSWTPVNVTIDPTTISYDLDNGGNGGTDHFLSFVIPFADLVALFADVGVLNVNENTAFAYVAATATQDNSLNQDFNGVNGGINSSTAWQDLGVLTAPISANGVTPVPEPSSMALLLVGAAAMCVGLRRRRSR